MIGDFSKILATWKGPGTTIISGGDISKSIANLWYITNNDNPSIS